MLEISIENHLKADRFGISPTLPIFQSFLKNTKYYPNDLKL